MAPSSIAIFPLPDVILFPGTFLPLHIFEPRYRLMIDYCSESDDELAVAPYLPKKGSMHQPIHDIHLKFGWGRIVQKEHLPDGRSNIVLEGMGVVELVEYRSMEPFRIASVREIPRIKADTEDVAYKEVLEEIIHLTKRIVVYENAPEIFLEMVENSVQMQYPFDFISSLLQQGLGTRQKILEEPDELKRGMLLRDVLRNLNLKE